MNRVFRLKMPKRHNPLIGNIGGVCIIFVLCSLIFAFLILSLSIRVETSNYSNRVEDLTSLRSMMRNLSQDLEKGDMNDVKESSLYIRESGTLSALSSTNRWKVYLFLNSLSDVNRDDYKSCAAYARKCTACIECELSGEEYDLVPWEEDHDDNDQMNGKNAINTAKTHSFVDLYPSLFSHGRFVVTYGSNYYKKIDYDYIDEYIYLSNTFDHEAESCDIGYLKERLHSFVENMGINTKVTFLFCEMGVAFFSCKDEFSAINVGISVDGEHLYLYSPRI